MPLASVNDEGSVEPPELDAGKILPSWVANMIRGHIIKSQRMNGIGECSQTVINKEYSKAQPGNAAVESRYHTTAPSRTAVPAIRRCCSRTCDERLNTRVDAHSLRAHLRVPHQRDARHVEASVGPHEYVLQGCAGGAEVQAVYPEGRSCGSFQNVEVHLMQARKRSVAEDEHTLPGLPGQQRRV